MSKFVKRKAVLYLVQLCTIDLLGVLYLTMTCLDISHAIQIVSEFVSNPHKPHLIAVHRILLYIRGTFDHGLFYFSDSHYIFGLRHMLIGLDAQTLDDLPLASVCSSAHHLFLGSEMSNYDLKILC